MKSYKPLCVLKASGCKRENVINIIFMLKMLPELYLTNATDYFFTFLDGGGSQNHTAEACRQGGFWGVSANNQSQARITSGSSQLQHRCYALCIGRERQTAASMDH